MPRAWRREGFYLVEGNRAVAQVYRPEDMDLILAQRALLQRLVDGDLSALDEVRELLERTK